MLPLLLHCFFSADQIATRKREQYGLPSRTSETSRGQTKSAFQGELQVFIIDGTKDDRDLMELLLNIRDIITDLKNSEVSNAAKKVKFVVPLDLNKEKSENDNEEQTTKIFGSSEMTTVYLDGLSNKDFLRRYN